MYNSPDVSLEAVRLPGTEGSECAGLGPAGSVAECSVVFGTSATVDGAELPLSQCDSLMSFVFWSCPLTLWMRRGEGSVSILLE